MKLYCLLPIQLILLAMATFSQAQERADLHAPIGVMGDHLHKEGEWMLSYRYMDMSMEGNREGTNRLSANEVRRPGGVYGVAPLNMDMQMHMFGGMYAINDDITVMLMLPFIDLSMEHQTAMPMPDGMRFTTESDGLGDTKASVLYRLSHNDNSVWILNWGLGLPTGSIDEEDLLPPIGQVGQLPFPMQLGSGTYDFIPGVTYTQQNENHSWGTQFKATIRTGKNNNDYTLGDRFLLTSWYARSFSSHALSWSVRLSYEDWDNIDGLDSEAVLPIRNMMGLTVPTVDPSLRAGKRLDVGLGLNWLLPNKKNRLAIEWSQPVKQDLYGPQLETDSILTLGWQYAF